MQEIRGEMLQALAGWPDHLIFSRRAQGGTHIKGSTAAAPTPTPQQLTLSMALG